VNRPQRRVFDADGAVDGALDRVLDCATRRGDVVSCATGVGLERPVRSVSGAAVPVAAAGVPGAWVASAPRVGRSVLRGGGSDGTGRGPVDGPPVTGGGASGVVGRAGASEDAERSGSRTASTVTAHAAPTPAARSVRRRAAPRRICS